MRLNLALALGLLAALLSSPSAFAEKADKGKPLNVEADKMQYDDLKQINIFTGNVRLTKGTIVITGEKVIVRQDPEGYQHGTAIGSLASFRQKREGVEQYVEGCGQQLDYNGKTETVKFTQKAQLKRLEGERITDEVYGDSIVYESLSEFFTVDGNLTKTGESTGRVKVIIQPKSELESGRPAASPAGTTATGASLKAATALSGKSGPAQPAKCR